MHNFLILFLQVLVVCGVSLVSLFIGEKALNAWLCVVAISMNLFVIKQIRLCGLEVTSTDSLSVGYILGLNLIQEYYGREAAKLHVAIAFVCSVGFVGLSYIHLSYFPSTFDTTHEHYVVICECLPRLLFASIASFVLVQLVDISFFSYLRKRFIKKFIGFRVGISLMLSQTLDTFIFSFLGLYGLVQNIWHIIFVSLLIKFVIILLSSPLAEISRLKVFSEKHGR